MPFTVAHAVVAPPLSKLSGGRLPIAELAVGSMAPDFAYVIFLDTNHNFGHRAPGVVLFCLPASLLVVALWHEVVKRPLASLLPDRWSHLGAALCRPRPPATWWSGVASVTAVLVAACTHVVWDSFGHRDGRAVQAFDVLRTRVHGHRLHVWVRYGSSVAGVAVLVVMIAIWARRQPRVAMDRPPGRHRVAAAAAISVVTLLATVANVARAGARHGISGAHQVLPAAALGAMAGGVVAVTAYGVVRGGRYGPVARPARGHDRS